MIKYNSDWQIENFMCTPSNFKTSNDIFKFVVDFSQFIFQNKSIILLVSMNVY